LRNFTERERDGERERGGKGRERERKRESGTVIQRDVDKETDSATES